MESFFLWTPSALEVVINKWQRRFEEHGFWKKFNRKSCGVKKSILKNYNPVKESDSIEMATFKELKKTFIFYLVAMAAAMLIFLFELLMPCISISKSRQPLSV